MAITTEMRTAVLELYTAYFNRAADKDGVDYWLNEMDSKAWTIDMVAQSFADQTEYTVNYGGLTNAQIVDKIYLNILDRTPDTDGATYWVKQLDDNIFPVSQIIQAVVNAATELDSSGNPVHVDDAAIVNNKSSVSQKFYDASSQDTTVSLKDVTKDVATIDTVFTTGIDIVYQNALTAYNDAVSKASTSKTAADTAALSVSTLDNANASLSAANTAYSDAQAVVAAATYLKTIATSTTSTTDDTSAANNLTTANTSLTSVQTLVTTAQAAVTAVTPVAPPATEITVSSTATLTTEIDKLVGDASNNLFIGDAASTVSADQIDGGAGTDIFKLYDGVGLVDIPTLTNVERIELVRFTDDLDITTISSDITQVALDDVTTAKTYTVNENISAIIRNMANNETVDLQYKVADTISKVTLDTFGNSTANANLDVNGGSNLLTQNITTEGKESFVTYTATGSAIETMNISGTKKLTIDVSGETSIKTLSASDMTDGGLDITLGAPATTIAFTGSAVDDIVTPGAAPTANDSFDGGAGTDTLVLASANAAAVAADRTIYSNISNFEKLQISDDLVSTFDISKLGVNYLVLADDSAGVGETISGFTSGATIESKDAVTMSNVLTIGISNATDLRNSTDVLNIKANADIVASDYTYKFDVAGIETLNIEATDNDNTTGTIDKGYIFTLSTDTSVKNLTITGDRKASYTTSTATELSTVDASAATGEVTFSATGVDLNDTTHPNSLGLTITGGTKDDTLTGSADNDTINGGAGADILDGDAGDDIFLINSIEESKADRITGGDGTDTIKIADAVVNSGGITQNLIDFTTPTNTILSNTAFTDGTVFATVENIDASAVTKAMKFIAKVNDAFEVTSGTAADVIKLNNDGDDVNKVVILTATNSINGSEDQLIDFVRERDTIKMVGDHGTNAIDLSSLTVTDAGDSAANTWEYAIGKANVILYDNANPTNLTTSVQLGDATTVNTEDKEKTFISNAATIVAGSKADYIVLGTAKQTVTLGDESDVVQIISGGSNDGSEDTIEDLTLGTDTLILTGANSVALDLSNVSSTQVGTTAYYENVLGSTHIITKNNATAVDYTATVQLGKTNAVYTTTAALVAGAKNDVVQNGSGSQNINLGAGDDILVFTSDTSGNATAGAETLDGGAETNQDIILITSTSTVNLSDDTITGFEQLKMTEDLLGNKTTTAQSVTLTAAQVDAFTKIFSSYDGTSGDTITLSDAMTSDMLNGTVIEGGLNIKLANTNNALTLVNATLANTTDTIYIDGTAMTGTSGLTFDGKAEATIGVTVKGGAGADSFTGTQKADTFTGGAGTDTFIITDGAGLTQSPVATANTLTTAGIANGDTLVFANGVDIITDFTTGVDDLDVETAETAPTSMMNMAVGALTNDTTYYLLGTYTNGIFTVDSTATSSTSNVAMLIVEGDGTQDQTNSNDYVLLTGVASLVAADFV